MIYKKTPNITKYIFIHDSDSFSLYIDIFAKNVVIPENDILNFSPLDPSGLEGNFNDIMLMRKPRF
jgi:hypothetical protein